MKFIKLAVLSAVVLFGLITLISSLLPSHIRISRAIDIHTDKEKVYHSVADISQWEQWNEYIRAYHNKKISSDEMIADEITIVFTTKTDSLITAEWRQSSGNQFGSGFAIIGRSSSHITVQWYFDFHVSWYPWEKFQSIIYDQQIGPIMEKSLANLKRIAENSK